MIKENRFFSLQDINFIHITMGHDYFVMFLSKMLIFLPFKCFKSYCSVRKFPRNINASEPEKSETVPEYNWPPKK